MNPARSSRLVQLPVFLVSLCFGVSWFRAEELKPALFDAAASGETARVETLLQRGASARSATSYGWTALMFAAGHGHLETSRLLLDRGADVNRATSGGAAERIEEPPSNIDRSVDRDRDFFTSDWLGSTFSIKYEHGATALMVAALAGHTDVVQLLTERGAALNVRDGRGCTALYLAVKEDRVPAARALIASGADVSLGLDLGDGLDEGSGRGHDLLESAVRKKSTAMVRLLLGAGVDPNGKDKSGVSVIVLAREENAPAIVRILREAGARR